MSSVDAQEPPQIPRAAAPARLRPGLVAAIVLGVTVPGAVLVALAGLLLGPRLVETVRGAGPASTRPTAEVHLATPVAGTCYIGDVPKGGLRYNAETDRIVPCGQAHNLEAIAAFPLALPAGSEYPPVLRSDPAHEMYAQCEQAAEQFLGLPWRATYTMLSLSLPNAQARQDGADWYRCDLTESTTINLGLYASTGALRGRVRPVTCLSWTVTSAPLTPGDILDSPCDRPHQAELAGTFQAPPTSRTDDPTFQAQLKQTCREVVQTFVAEPALAAGLSFIDVYPIDADQLDQNVLCLVATGDLGRAFTASVKGLGTSPVPFG